MLSMTRIEDIEQLTGVAFDEVIREADQFDTVRGTEIARRSGAQLRKR